VLAVTGPQSLFLETVKGLGKWRD